jgi:transcriptional regulator with XRE-family HTH domain
MTKLRSLREALGVSQIRLARLAKVSRFKICVFELGDGKLTEDEQNRISAALQAEIDRLRNLPVSLGLAAPEEVGSVGGGRAA